MPRIILILPNISERGLRIASPDKWETIANPEVVASLLPDPGSEWKLAIPQGVSSESKKLPQPEILGRKVPTPKLWWEKDIRRHFMAINFKKK